MAELDNLFGGENKPAEPAGTSKEDWQIKREQSRTQAYEMLAEATTEISDPEIYAQYLDVQSRFDRYSVSNALLISYQLPEATRLADSKYWQQHGAYIQKGERAITILEPGKNYTRKNGEQGIFYEPKKVFDISQTTIEVKRTERPPVDEKLLIKALMRTSPVEMKISNQLQPDVNAMYSQQDKTIFVRQGMSGKDIFRALAQEIVKARADKGGDLAASSFAIQSVSYMICKRNGIDPPASPSGTPFKDMEAKDVRAVLKGIRDEANNMSAVMEKTLHPKSREER